MVSYKFPFLHSESLSATEGMEAREKIQFTHSGSREDINSMGITFMIQNL